MFTSVINITAQNEKINLIISEIKTDDKELSIFCKTLTDQLEAIISSIPILNLLERRKYASLESQLKNEQLILGSDFNIRDFTVKRKTANQVILGSIYQNKYKEQYILEFSISDLITTEMKKEILIFEKNDFIDTKLRNDKLQDKIEKIYFIDKDFLNEVDIGMTAWSNYKNDLAFYLLNKHVNKPNFPIDGYYELGCLYLDGMGTDIDFSKAKTLFERASKMNHIRSINKLAEMYEEGLVNGVKNYSEAMRLYLDASNKGCALSEYNIGKLYYFGLGVDKNFCIAEKWFEKAASHGEPKAFFQIGFINFLGNCKKKDLKKAYINFLESCETENEAYFFLGELLFHGGEGISINYTGAYFYYNRYIDNIENKFENYYLAKSQIGFALLNGLGIEKNFLGAYDPLFEAATDGNEVVSQYNLGLMYLNLVNNIDNKNEAINWLKKAAGNGYELAKNKLKDLGIGE
ncbi:MAG TPA: tetratricopeptide repeat protein [Saprospiraceae bacterium]|nr:tetratricopeptide repeat protein [Saprospiraceae bacterium]